jgi:hypothetical protein
VGGFKQATDIIISVCGSFFSAKFFNQSIAKNLYKKKKSKKQL